MVIMMTNFRNSSPVLYLKSHIFKSTHSAVKLAEKKNTPANICFSKRLLKIKNSSNYLILSQKVIYDNTEMKRSEKYRHLLSRVNNLFPDLPPKDYLTTDDAAGQFNGINKSTKIFNYVSVPKIQRYVDIETAVCSQIKTSKGTAMPANQIKVKGKEIAIRCQYPKAEYMREHFRMLLDKKPVIVVILSSSKDISDKNLPRYFCENKNYDEISVICETKIDNNTKMKTEEKLGDLILNHHRMNISDKKNTLSISVIHVTNWSDNKSINAEELKELASIINRKVKEKHDENSSLCEQPLIHCNAGVGRTGTLIGALALVDKTNKSSVKQVVLDMRRTGSGKMVQTLEQYKTLLELKGMLNPDMKEMQLSMASH